VGEVEGEVWWISSNVVRLWWMKGITVWRLSGEQALDRVA
jgi:hypothetical protein